MNSQLIPFLKDMGFSPYVLMLAERGDEKMKQECLRLVEKMREASVLARNPMMFDLLSVEEGIEERIKKETSAWVAKKIEEYSSRIVRAQKLVDMGSRMALILHTSKEKWSQYEDYEQYNRRFDAFTKDRLETV
jgi:hypothetical protein